MKVDSPPASRKKSPALLAAAALCVAAGIGFWLLRGPAPSVPLPDNLEVLDPQVRAYVQEKASWVQARPRSAERQATLGLVYAANGLWVPAAQAFTNAWQLDAREPLALMYCGVAAAEAGQTESALQVFETLTQRFREFAPGFYRYGHLLVRSGRFADAEPVFKRLSTLAPNEWRAYSGLGEIALRLGRPAEAVTFLERAVQLDPSARGAFHLLGQAYGAIGRTQDAEVALSLGRNAVEYPMDDPWAASASQHMKLLPDQLQAAREYVESGEPGRAIQLLTEASKYHPEHPGLLNQLAAAYNQASQPAKGLILADHVLKTDPRHVPAHITRAFSLQMLNRFDEAVAAADQGIALAPKIAEGHIARANALLAAERDEEALKSLEAAHQLDPQQPEILVECGDVLWRNLKRPAEARIRYEKARQAAPGFAPVYVRLADLEITEGHRAAAEASIAQLRRLAPGHPDLAALEARLQSTPAR